MVWDFQQQRIRKALSLYDDDAAHFSPKLKLLKPETNGLINGKQSLREKNLWPIAKFKLQSDLSYCKWRSCLEYIRTTDNEEEMLIAEVLDVRDDKIIASRVYHG
jgi:hypothetical protein